ncbi:tetratricopeptide repeat protein [Nannocystis sp. SCPEA4]|uniref:tetratricopeptide repeat protein n=1 Tax=Nannocystis sp. SCPEA4 TaxID=2996787 RepID=UPI00226DECC6|nr:tetratricopeptide repeat protein [Nannocystis sp. SCPEA4]MCY1060259.1 tetratricopeptide repeat protein [Nannocystis sp. SCPEA4]
MDRRPSPLAASLLWFVSACSGASQAPASPQSSLPPAPTCEASECNTQGMLALGLQRPDEAMRLLDRACSLGHAVGCSNLAGVFRGGVGGGPKDPPRAVGLYDRSCRLGFAEACATVGTMLAEGTAVPADPPRALGMFELACAKQDAFACFTAGLFYETGRGVPARDPKRAASSFGQACGLGHATGCFNAGILLYSEEGARPGENERAVEYFARACDGAQPAGCLRHGLAALRGVGTAADAGKAASLFARACQGGDDDGCGLAEQLKKARGRKIEVALTSRAPTLTMAGLTAHELSCRMPQTDPLALAEALEGVAAHKAALDACAPAGDAVAVAWSYRGGRAALVRVEGADPRVAGCVRKAVERARSSLTASCAATVLIGEAAGARKALAERRSSATGTPVHPLAQAR